MNLGQIYETVLGWAGQKLGLMFATPIFDGATVGDLAHVVRQIADRQRNEQTEIQRALIEAILVAQHLQNQMLTHTKEKMQRLSRSWMRLVLSAAFRSLLRRIDRCH